MTTLEIAPEPMRRGERAICLRCGTAADASMDACPHCGVELAGGASARRALAGAHTVTIDATRGVRRALPYALGLVGVTLVGVWYNHLTGWLGTRDPVLEDLLIVASFLTAFGVLGVVHSRRARRARAQRAWRARGRLESMPLARIASLVPGDEGQRVRFAGRAETVRALRHPAGGSCLAFEREDAVRPDGKVLLHVAGGEFDVDDGSGVRARVRAEHVVIEGGERVGEDLVVPEGCTIEVCGRARWTAAREADALSLRRSALGIEVAGTAEEPVVIRCVARAGAGVRVDAGAAVRERRGERGDGRAVRSEVDDDDDDDDRAAGGANGAVTRAHSTSAPSPSEEDGEPRRTTPHDRSARGRAR